MADYDDARRTQMAAIAAQSIGVPESAVSVHVRAASVEVEIVIVASSEADGAAIAHHLNAHILPNASAASVLFHMNVTDPPMVLSQQVLTLIRAPSSPPNMALQTSTHGRGATDPLLIALGAGLGTLILLLGLYASLRARSKRRRGKPVVKRLIPVEKMVKMPSLPTPPGPAYRGSYYQTSLNL